MTKEQLNQARKKRKAEKLRIDKVSAKVVDDKTTKNPVQTPGTKRWLQASIPGDQKAGSSQECTLGLSQGYPCRIGQRRSERGPGNGNFYDASISNDNEIPPH